MPAACSVSHVSDSYRGGEPVAEVVRSGFVESRHHGSVAVLDAAGTVVAAVGDIAAPVFPRSSNKPLQAAGMLRAGFAPADAAELALVAASHRGEDFHVTGTRAMLHRAGLPESALRCPATVPLSDPCGEFSRASNNCSGKHAGMLLTCLAAGWPVDGYWEAAHPLQVAIRATVEELAGERVGGVGVDGCGAPVVAVSLKALAGSYLRLVTGGSEVADAMRAHPGYVSGTGPQTHDTVRMRAVPGLLAKGGAEGVQAVAVPGVGAVAMKIDDGSKRALMPVLSWALTKLGLDTPTPAEPVLGGGDTVGFVRHVL
ncbi:asparaginase [Virgisporangium ochraceum]